MTMHAVVVRQPWASLIAHGIKTIETRGFVPKSTVRPGDRLAIVAGLTVADYADAPEAWDRLAVELDVPLFRLGRELAGLFHRPAPGRPLGAVVAVVTYDEALRIEVVLPKVDRAPGDRAYCAAKGNRITVHPLSSQPTAYRWDGGNGHDIAAHLPLGDFTPGRYGWMLSNPLRLPIPVRCRAVGPDGTRTNMQGVFRLPAAVEAAVVAQIGGES